MNCHQVTQALKELNGIKTDTALAELLGVERQHIQRYKNRKTTDIQTTIIKLLLDRLTQAEMNQTEIRRSYQHPSDPQKTWSGYGRKPLWVEELEKQH